MSNLGLSVIICAYSEARWNDLLQAIASVKRQSHPPDEIIVVIDHNPALLARLAEAMPDIVVVENREQQGLSGARNSGVAVARGSVIAFLDDDAEAAPDWLARLVAAYDEQNVLGAGGAITPVWATGRPAWFPQEFDWVVGCTYRGMPEVKSPVRNLIGCNMSFRRSTLSEVGGFQSTIGRVGTRPLGCEETELCIRAIQHCPDGVLLYVPEAEVLHKVPAARARWSYFRSRCYSEGLSKAAVTRFVGVSSGLTSEWTYTRRTLPQGVIEGIVSMVRGRDGAGLKRAAAIMAGLAMTSLGYLRGLLSTH